jgi:hypothetical protein
VDFGEVILLRADTAAEAHLAETLKQLYEEMPERFDEDQIDALRQTFKLGWMTGFRSCLNDMEGTLKELLEENDD